MNKADLDKLNSKTVPPSFTITASEFSYVYMPRTLLFGYTAERKSWHVYMDTLSGVNVYVYEVGRENQGMLTSRFNSYDELVPNKRLYPECCYFDFCKFLQDKGVYLPFTKYNEVREIKRFYGEVAEQHKHIPGMGL